MGGACLRVLFKFTDAFSGNMTAPFVIDLGYTASRLCDDRQGRRLCRGLAWWLRRRFLRARMVAAGLSVVRQGSFRRCRTSCSSGSRPSASINGRSLSPLQWRIHRRNRHGHLRRLPVGALQKSDCTPPRNSHCLTAMSAVGRTYLSSTGRLCCRSGRLATVLRISVLVAIPSLLCSRGCNDASILRH